MRGVRSKNLKAMVDFLYCGEANIPQDDLDSFFVLASELQVMGMTEEIFTKEAPQKNNIKEEPPNLFVPLNIFENVLNPTNKTKTCNPHVVDENALNEETDKRKKQDVIDRDQSTSKYPIHLGTPPIVGDLEHLDTQVKSMMCYSENVLGGNYGNRRARSCTVCGKEGYRNDIMNHIESHHITGVSHSCLFCSKTFRIRHTMRMHISVHHKK